MIKKYYLLFILLIPVLIHPPQLYSSDKSINYEFETIKHDFVHGIFPIDLNDDGIEEIIIKHTSQIDVWDSKFERDIQSFLIPMGRKYGMCPIKTGRLDSLCFLLHYTTKDSSVYKLLRYFNDGIIEQKDTLNYIIFTGTDVDGDGVFYQTIKPCDYIVNSSGKRLLIFSLNSGGDKAKRGIFAAIPETGKVFWKYLMGPQVFRVIIDDINEDGLKEIVLGTYAPDNHIYYNGTKDDSSYVFVIDCDGNLRWRYTVGPFFTGAWTDVCDVTGDGKKEIIVFRYGANPDVKNQNELILLNPKTGEVSGSTQAGKKFNNISFKYQSYNYTGYCYDLNRDEKYEILIGNNDGIVRMFDSEPKVIRTSDNFEKEIYVSEIADLDGDHLPEVICKTADNRMIILNHQLRFLKDYNINPGSTISVVRSRAKSYILILRVITGGRREYNLLEFHPVGLVREAVSRYNRTILWISGGILIILLFLFIRNLFLGEQSKRILYNFLEKAGLLNKAFIIKNNRTIIRIGTDWEKLLNKPSSNFIGKKYSEIFSEETNPLFNVLNEIFKKRLSEQMINVNMETKYRLIANFIPLIRIFCIFLIDLSEQERLRQVKAWAPVAQRLAHGIKNPLTIMKLNAEELWDLLRTKFKIEDKDIDDSFQVIIEQTDLLKKMSDGFMRFVQFEKPQQKAIALNEQIKELILQWQPSDNADIKIEYELNTDLPEALIDPEQFAFVLQSIFFNALDSIKEKGRILISTKSVQIFKEGDKRIEYAEINIQDTGIGIPKEYLEKIFQPYFSLKKGGTGMGLSIVKKIMEDHGGEIIIDSDEGVGTMVTLRFPIA